jgi:hypothetical protein
MTGGETRLPDIDIDVKDRVAALSGISHVSASLYQDGDLRRHPTGLVCQDVPVDPFSGSAAFPSGGRHSEDVLGGLGFQKIDVIPNSAYSLVDSQSEIDELVASGFDFSLLDDRELVSKLHHVGGHVDLVLSYRPRSILELAAIVSVIRPGKRHLRGLEIDEVLRQAWTKDRDGYAFKKSHAVAYAMMIMVQAHSIDRSSNGAADELHQNS